MRTARWQPTLATFLCALAAPGASTWAYELCGDWPTAAAAHQLGVEIQAGEVEKLLERIQLACVTHQEFACSIVYKTAATAERGPRKAALTLRLSAAGVEPISRIAAGEGRVTGRIVRRQDLDESAAVPDWIAVKSAQRARITTLLARADLTDLQRDRLRTSLKWVDQGISRLTAINNELRPRVDTDTLYIEVTAAR